jgi:dTDP-4-dehydrorhamnose reductase
MRIMFDAISVTNETSFVPSTNGGECEGAGRVDNNEGQEEEQPPIIPNDRPTSAKRPATSSLKGKKKKTFRDQYMKCLVDAYEKKSESSDNSATSKVVTIS